jgi:hypothetical protein
MDFELIFPKLIGTAYRLTSARDDGYNCIAWAAGDPKNWWWPYYPSEDKRIVWPDVVPVEETLDAFEALFIWLGYVLCTNEVPEPGVEKIALFASSGGWPTHAARQLSNGKWTSKLGKSEDIEHDLHALEGDVYGQVLRIFRRPAPV